MKTINDFKPGDFIYYNKKVGEPFIYDTIPAIVIKVHKKMLTITESEEDESYRVLKKNCEHQN